MANPSGDDPVTVYYRSAPDPQRQTLLAMRAILSSLLPEADEVISYGVPTFKVQGAGVAGLAWYAKHCSYLPMSGSVTAALAQRLSGYRSSKGAVQCAIDAPLPADLISELVAVRLAELDVSRKIASGPRADRDTVG